MTPAKKKRSSAVVTPSRIMARENQRRALELRKAGVSYRDIANELGYADHSGARKAVVAAMHEVIQEPTKELRSIQVERANRMLMALWPACQRGDESAINTALRVMDKIDAYMGTEQAQEVNVNHKGAVMVIDADSTQDDFLSALAAMAGVDKQEVQAELSAQQHQKALQEAAIDVPSRSVEEPEFDVVPLYDTDEDADTVTYVDLDVTDNDHKENGNGRTDDH